MEILGHRTYFFTYSKDKRKSTLSIIQNFQYYFSQGKEKQR